MPLSAVPRECAISCHVLPEIDMESSPDGHGEAQGIEKHTVSSRMATVEMAPVAFLG